jgi:single-strand DNA-binding protein
MSRSVNKVILIGNLTRDPEVRYTPQGNAVASFGVATNREWTVDGNKKEVVDFHNLVAWNKLAELCGQLLSKGSKVYVEGRLQTRDWTTDDGQKRYKTEVVIDEMIVLSEREPQPVRSRNTLLLRSNISRKRIATHLSKI